MTAVSVSNAWSYDRLIQRSGAVGFMLAGALVADLLRRACPEHSGSEASRGIDPFCLLRGHRLLST
jgi:hypothetical protein